MKAWTLRQHDADDGSVYWSLVSNDHDIHIAVADDTPGLWVAVWMGKDDGNTCLAWEKRQR